MLDILGIDSDILKEVEENEREKEEEKIKKKRMFNDKINKKKNRKALKILGHNPSIKKIEETLGEVPSSSCWVCSHINDFKKNSILFSTIIFVPFITYYLFVQ